MRGHLQQFVQRLLVEEVTMRLGRAMSARRAAVDAPKGYRNGYGKPRKMSLTCGTITVQRPRMLAARFASRLLPLSKRRTKQVGELSAISSWRSGGCWARGHRCRQPRSNGSRPRVC